MPGNVSLVQATGLDLGEGIEMVAELGRGAHTAVYRIRRAGVDYALKILQRRIFDDDRTEVAFCREATLLARVNHPGVPKVFDVGTAGGGDPYLILEFIDGQPLSGLLATNAINEASLVRLATDVAAALGAAHAAGLVHRDIKPANIMVMSSGHGRLIDFGLAAAGKNVPTGESVAGTFHYSAPEQTGMLARPVDGRADLYALGVVLFECATGVLPFRADDVGELIAMHLSAPAPDARSLRPEISEGLAAVIGRLLAKDPDDRFQSAGELLAALDGLDGATGETVDRSTGPADIAVSQLRGAGTLIGQDRELGQLIDRWRRARAGAGGIALVDGAPGAGKSTLARRIVAAAGMAGALVLTGKCDPDSSLPLGPLRTAVDGYLRFVRDLPAADRAVAVAGLRAAAGASAGSLRPLSSALAELLDAPELTAEDRHEQFAAAVACFLVALARDTGGLLIVLDDVHWLDPASQAVVRRLADEIVDAPVLVVATARDDERSAGGVAEFETNAGSRLDLRVHVGPLDDDGVARLVSSYLAGSVVSRELITEIAGRGRGNPFTILEYLHALAGAGALRPSWGTWRLDQPRLQSIDLPTEVLDLVLARIDGLGARTQRVLTIAAAIGSRFDAEVLADVDGADVSPNLSEAAGHGLVQPGDAGFTFVHDHIREALLAALAPDGRRALHQRIATVLDRRQRVDSAHVYAVARHYASGEVGRTPDRVFDTGWSAGKLALDENAPDAAVSFLEPAATAAQEAGILPDSLFREALGVAYLFTGRLEAARRQLEEGLAAEPDRLRRAALLLQLAEVNRTGWQFSQSIVCAQRGLAELGRPMARHPVLLGLATMGLLLSWLVTGSRPVRSQPVRDERYERLRMHTTLCRAGAAAAAINLQQPLLMAFTLRANRSVERLGPTAEYVLAQAGLGTLAGALHLRRRRDRIFRRAFQIAGRLGDPQLHGRVAWMEAFAKVISKDATSEEWSEVAEEQRRWLELDYYINIVGVRCQNLISRGYATEALEWYEHGRVRLSAAAAGTITGLAISGDMARALLGKATDAPLADPAGLWRSQEHSPELPEQGAVTDNPALRLQFVIRAVQAAVEHDELGEPFETAIEMFRGLGLATSAFFAENRMFFVHQAFGRLALCRRSAAEPEAGLLAAASAVRELRKIANNPLLRAYHWLAQASLFELRGQHHQALRVLAGAEKALVYLDAPLIDFEAARVRARALHGLGYESLAARHARTALTIATQHGWMRRIRWIGAEFGAPAASVPRAPGTWGHGHEQTADESRYRRRLEALQQVSTASAKVLDPQELARVALDETLRILGAERAILFLVDEHGSARPSLGRDAAVRDLDELSRYSSTLVDRVVADRKALVVTGSDEGAALGSHSAVLYDLRSIMIAPLELDGRLLGVLYLDSRIAKGIFTAEDINILTAIASHIAVSLETARAVQLEVTVHAARQQRDTAETLRDAMNELAATLDPDEVFKHLLDIVARTVPADRLCLLRRDGTKLFSGLDGPDPAEVDTDALFALTGPRHGTRSGTPPAITALLGDIQGWLATPVNTPEYGNAVLIGGSTTVRAFDKAHVDVVSALAEQGATAYEKARLFAQVQQMANTDGLTGVNNRRHFTELASRQLSIAVRNHRPLVALMVDIDRFKKVNDTYGHATGDEAIRTVARILQTHLRDPDVFCRYGGEEFAAILSEVHGDPMEVGERLRAAVAAGSVPSPAGPVRITVSVGMAELKPDDGIESLLSRSDEALFRAKNAGRNQVQAG